ncbi:hypothetical protein VTL71DRAFT_13606 [Oculimacula yallundae]|uniref:Uncharacterized protein n=1 Tax=Oculimacula yallundae TaxID=86028 RepID=A0ABR4CKV2_9HELO
MSELKQVNSTQMKLEDIAQVEGHVELSSMPTCTCMLKCKRTYQPLIGLRGLHTTTTHHNPSHRHLLSVNCLCN